MKFLVEYIREFPYDINKLGGIKEQNTKGFPIGCIVALSPTQIGWSICCPKDQFIKERGKAIAIGRAEKNHHSKIPHRIVDFIDIDDYNTKPLYLKDLLECKLNEMKERAQRYFK